MRIIKCSSGGFHLPSGIRETRDYHKIVKNPNPQRPVTEEDRERYRKYDWWKNKEFYDEYISLPFPKEVELSLCGRSVLPIKYTAKNSKEIELSLEKNDWAAGMCDACWRIWRASETNSKTQ